MLNRSFEKYGAHRAHAEFFIKTERRTACVEFQTFSPKQSTRFDRLAHELGTDAPPLTLRRHREFAQLDQVGPIGQSERQPTSFSPLKAPRWVASGS